MMFYNKKVIIFDLDGTLIDSINIWNEIDKKLIYKLGYQGNLKTSLIQKYRDEILEKYHNNENPYLCYCEKLKEKYNLSISCEKVCSMRYEIAHEYTSLKVKYKKDADKLIKLLYQNNFTLVIASTTGRKNINIYENENQNIIKKANFKDYFTLIYTKDDVKNIKPNPEVYYKIFEKLNVTASECLVFEDSLVGIMAAKNCGISVVAMADKYSAFDSEKIKALADYNFQSFIDVINVLNSEIRKEKIDE